MQDRFLSILKKVLVLFDIIKVNFFNTHVLPSKSKEYYD